MFGFLLTSLIQGRMWLGCTFQSWKPWKKKMEPFQLDCAMERVQSRSVQYGVLTPLAIEAPGLAAFMGVWTQAASSMRRARDWNVQPSHILPWISEVNKNPN